MSTNYERKLEEAALDSLYLGKLFREQRERELEEIQEMMEEMAREELESRDRQRGVRG